MATRSELEHAARSAVPLELVDSMAFGPESRSFSDYFEAPFLAGASLAVLMVSAGAGAKYLNHYLSCERPALHAYDCNGDGTADIITRGPAKSPECSFLSKSYVCGKSFSGFEE